MAIVNGIQVDPAEPRDGLANSKKAMRNRALLAYADLTPTVVRYRNEGMSLLEIANSLNREGRRTRKGSQFRPTTVLRILDRVGYVSVY